jgi:hypothetical protein
MVALTVTTLAPPLTSTADGERVSVDSTGGVVSDFAQTSDTTVWAKPVPDRMIPTPNNMKANVTIDRLRKGVAAPRIARVAVVAPANV